MVTMGVVPIDDNPDAAQAYFLALLERVRQIPGIAAAGGVDQPPLFGGGSYTGADANGRSTGVAVRRVLPGYFEAVGLPLGQGRFPTTADYGRPTVRRAQSVRRARHLPQSISGRTTVHPPEEDMDRCRRRGQRSQQNASASA